MRGLLCLERRVGPAKAGTPNEPAEAGTPNSEASRRRELQCASATRDAIIFPAIHLGKSPQRRDACAPRNSPRHLSPNYHL